MAFWQHQYGCECPLRTLDLLVSDQATMIADPIRSFAPDDRQTVMKIIARRSPERAAPFCEL